jgi:hypothetical protein
LGKKRKFPDKSITSCFNFIIVPPFLVNLYFQGLTASPPLIIMGKPSWPPIIITPVIGEFDQRDQAGDEEIFAQDDEVSSQKMPPGRKEGDLSS